MIGNVPACTLHKCEIKFSEHAASAVGNGTVNECGYHTLDLRIALCNVTGNIVRHNLLQFLYSCTEDIFVLCSGFLGNLNVSSVQCAERNCAVEHKLHIACT